MWEVTCISASFIFFGNLTKAENATNVKIQECVYECIFGFQPLVK